MTLSLILRFNLRLGGYSICSVSTSRTIYDQDFVAWAPHSLEATGSTWRTTRCIWRKAQKQPEGCSDYLMYSKMPSQVLDACRTRLRRARGLVRPGAAGLIIGIECSRVRDSSWIYLTVTNMAPFMPFRVILVIEWQHNTWTNMIIKMIILRLLGSSDDKKKEKIGVASPEGLLFG